MRLFGLDFNDKSQMIIILLSQGKKKVRIDLCKSSSPTFCLRQVKLKWVLLLMNLCSQILDVFKDRDSATTSYVLLPS